MKKTLVTFASAMVLTMAFSQQASARDGFYVAVRGGNTNYNLNNKEDNATSTARVEFGDAWNMSGAIGYKYKYFRVEGEYIYRDTIEDTYYDTDGDISNKASLDTDSFMLNAYLDFMPNYWISPYINGGIGLTRIDLENQDAPFNINQKRTYSKDNFTWALGAGLSIRLNKCLNIDGGYRYLDMGDINDANINAHEVYGGLRFTF